ncbi:glycoside hydrolase [Gymnopus androsaceus JB14]|uniref:glucan endo-1,3-beta-D-glucosidase n=1 Tax=Gymnopus androsaceus JB14 TaxID=1447944 RepID=A0A6A4ICE2_9AGAR|nr:glycoside hydrolase [Gymnopus androsaceus JB14]
MYSQARDATNSSDLQDYYDNIPPAHRLSTYSTPSQNIPLTASSSVADFGAEPYSDIPARTRPHYGDRRGEFAAANTTPYIDEKAPSSNKRKWIMAVAIVGTVLGVVLSRKSSSSSSKDSVSGDPSQFTKDSRLKQSFWGIAYTPEGTLYPDCGAKLSDVVTDIQLLSQLTTRIRLYGADCNTTALVLDAIQLTKVNMSMLSRHYGTDHIAGVTVGNEFILDYLNANSATDPNSATGNAGAAILTAFINDTKTMLSDMSVSLKIGNADAGSYFNDLVLEDVDYGMANVHPWFANVSIDDAAGWTWDFFETNDVALAKELSNTPDMSIAETGWPTKSSDAGNESNGPSTASEANLQTFLNTFVCQANANGTEYFFFEYFDETWKDEEYGGVEVRFSCFTGYIRTLKNIEIPDCSGSSTSTSSTSTASLS